MWHFLRNKTDDLGFTFKNVIFAGCKHDQLTLPDIARLDFDQKPPLGIFAACHNTYEVFHDFFDVLISEYHFGFDAQHDKHFEGMAKELPYMSDQELELIKDIKMSVRRNLRNYAMGPGIREK